jgi:hypothetical protein
MSAREQLTRLRRGMTIRELGAMACWRKRDQREVGRVHTGAKRPTGCLVPDPRVYEQAAPGMFLGSGD